jgi:hypothetical protein
MVPPFQGCVSSQLVRFRRHPAVRRCYSEGQDSTGLSYSGRGQRRAASGSIADREAGLKVLFPALAHRRHQVLSVRFPRLVLQASTPFSFAITAPLPEALLWLQDCDMIMAILALLNRKAGILPTLTERQRHGSPVLSDQLVAWHRQISLRCRETSAFRYTPDLRQGAPHVNDLPKNHWISPQPHSTPSRPFSLRAGEWPFLPQIRGSPEPRF